MTELMIGYLSSSHNFDGSTDQMWDALVLHEEIDCVLLKETVTDSSMLERVHKGRVNTA